MNVIDLEERRIKKAAEELYSSISPLIEQLNNMRQEAKKLGIFVDDRALAQCDSCNIFEDVTARGQLCVHEGTNFNVDLGIRFIELEDQENALQCPLCNKIFCPIDEHHFIDWTS